MKHKKKFLKVWLDLSMLFLVYCSFDYYHIINQYFLHTSDNTSAIRGVVSHKLCTSIDMQSNIFKGLLMSLIRFTECCKQFIMKWKELIYPTIFCHVTWGLTDCIFEFLCTSFDVSAPILRSILLFKTI